MDAIAGAIAGLRMLADGSVRLTVDLEPKDRMQAMELFGTPGAMVALARLQDGTGAVKEPDPRGPNCMEAIGLTNNAEFQKWVQSFDFDRPLNPEAARKFIMDRCGVQTRKDLDQPDVASLFRAMKGEFSRWCIARGGR